MKVAYNNCFGGFSLSSEAVNLYAKKKGICLTWYHHELGSDYMKVDVPNTKSWGFDASTIDLGGRVKSIPDENFYYPDYDRADPDLISVIEELGSEKASGSCGSLAIRDIPDGSEYEITDYDGNEDVVPTRSVW